MRGDGGAGVHNLSRPPLHAAQLAHAARVDDDLSPGRTREAGCCFPPRSTACGRRGASPGRPPVVGLETAVVQSAESHEVDVLAMVEEVLRHRVTTHDRLLRSCRRGVAGSGALRRALEVVADGDLELLKRRLGTASPAVGRRHRAAQRGPGAQRVGCGRLSRPRARRSGNVVELDGWARHSERGRFLADRRRDRWVRREHGLVTTRVAADEARADLPAVVAELLPLRRRAAGPCPDAAGSLVEVSHHEEQRPQHRRDVAQLHPGQQDGQHRGIAERRRPHAQAVRGGGAP